MKKLLLTVLLVLFAATANAEFKFEMTGDMYEEGTYWHNNSKTKLEDTVNYGYYDGQINLYPKIIVNNSSINFKVTMLDENWRQGTYDTRKYLYPTTATVGTQTVVTGFTNESQDNRQYDVYMDKNISIERAWLQHKFTDKSVLDVGLMDGGTWGTTFGDDLSARYRIKFTQTTPVGIFLGLIEKMNEQGSYAPTTKNADKDDSTDYAVGYIGKFDKVYVKQLIYYCDLSSWGPLSTYAIDQGSDGLKRWLLALEVSANFGTIAFESEIDYNKYNLEYTTPAGTTDTDWSAFGLYLNVWANLSAAKVGGMVAYGSYDKDEQKGLDFDDDFNSTLILGDEMGFGGGDDLNGMTIIKPYIADIKTPVENLTFDAYFAYIMSNQEENSYEDATAMELEIGGAYKITDNLTYSAHVAFADISYDVEGVEDPDSIYQLQHTISLKF